MLYDNTEYAEHFWKNECEYRFGELEENRITQQLSIFRLTSLDSQINKYLLYFKYHYNRIEWNHLKIGNVKKIKKIKI